MKFPAKQNSTYTLAPEGNHVAICNAVVDMGMQPGSAQYPDPKRQVYIRFELPDEQTEYKRDGETVTGPLSIGSTFTASMHEKASLRKFVESWHAKKFPNDDAAADFDLSKLLGRQCLLNVAHKESSGKTYANIVSAAPIPKSMKVDVKQENASLYFTLDDADQEVFERLPEWLRKKIDARIKETQIQKKPVAAAAPVAAGDADFDDDIPF